jgi:beta-lactamase superfamily II metal-dependent hydrolase
VLITAIAIVFLLGLAAVFIVAACKNSDPAMGGIALALVSIAIVVVGLHVTSTAAEADIETRFGVEVVDVNQGTFVVRQDGTEKRCTTTGDNSVLVCDGQLVMPVSSK